MQKTGAMIAIPVLNVTIYPVLIAESVRIVRKAFAKTVAHVKIVLI